MNDLGDGSGTVVLAGTSPQTVTSTGGVFPNVKIDSTSDVTFATGTHSICGNFTYVSATSVTFTGTTIDFTNHCGGAKILASGSLIFDDVAITRQSDLDISGTTYISGDLTVDMSGSSTSINTGTIALSGDLNIVSLLQLNDAKFTF